MFQRLSRAWAVLRRPSTRFSLLALLVAGGIAGILFWGGFHTALEATNTVSFCTSCHEMDTVYAEYKETIHYSNRSGVRAGCPDCHVPREWGPKLLRKMEASKELWGKMTGFINTPEKFEKHRTELAQHEWARMKANNSLACRNCHSVEGMNPDKQTEKAKSRHAKAKNEGMTCIDCHFGIAHKEPEGPGPQELFGKNN